MFPLLENLLTLFTFILPVYFFKLVMWNFFNHAMILEYPFFKNFETNCGGGKLFFSVRKKIEKKWNKIKITRWTKFTLKWSINSSMKINATGTLKAGFRKFRFLNALLCSRFVITCQKLSSFGQFNLLFAPCSSTGVNCDKGISAVF